MGASITEISKINKILSRGYGADGVARPYTDAEFFQVSWEMGANQLNSNYRHLFSNLAKWISEELQPKSALEIGCGPGYLLNCLNELKIDAYGVDGNPFSKQLFTREHPQYADKYFLDKEFENHYSSTDALVTIECFEHIPDSGLHITLEKITKKLSPEFIVFSSTPYPEPNPDWDVMWGHINMKTEAQWIELFAKYGYDVVPNIRPPVTPWALLFQNSKARAIKPYQPKK
jgi:2-polyprenyl-3-methyl-5-hydroxy-6-metoxy-1,4-benzoquinol methylase